jgi:hypothetical protein
MAEGEQALPEPELFVRARSWIADDPDPETRAELEALVSSSGPRDFAASWVRASHG